jgi:hypothetical protein
MLRVRRRCGEPSAPPRAALDSAVGLLAGFEPARLPPALLSIAVYKLVFIAALAILAAGATVLRHAGRSAEQVARGQFRDAAPRIIAEADPSASPVPRGPAG